MKRDFKIIEIWNSFQLSSYINKTYECKSNTYSLFAWVYQRDHIKFVSFWYRQRGVLYLWRSVIKRHSILPSLFMPWCQTSSMMSPIRPVYKHSMQSRWYNKNQLNACSLINQTTQDCVCVYVQYWII